MGKLYFGISACSKNGTHFWETSALAPRTTFPIKISLGQQTVIKIYSEKDIFQNRLTSN
jgi:hypothetical protein